MDKPMKFLVVDDEKDVEMLFRQKFRKEVRKGSLELEFAFSGDDAIKVLRSNDPPEVMYIFSDINMESGAKAFFTKPIDFNSLKEEVNQLIEAN